MQVRSLRTRKQLFTADELLHLSSTGRRYELVEGELFEMPPAGARHGSVAMQIGALLNAHVRTHQLGKVFAAETGFILRRNPDTVRAPDASFVSQERLPSGELPTGFMDLAPDLSVEVVSPTDRAREIQEKVADWLRAGTTLVWVIDPASHSATAYRSLDDFRELSESDSLEGGEVIPGFVCPVKDLFS
jgi:Uma2 family endonuclease